MRFVNVNSAKNLKINDQVFTLDSEGRYGTGKLISRIENGNGLLLKFEVPQYFNEAAPAINPVVVENITHVCVMKDRTLATSEEVAEANPPA